MQILHIAHGAVNFHPRLFLEEFESSALQGRGLPLSQAPARGFTGVPRHGGTLLSRLLAKRNFSQSARKFLSGPSPKASLGLGSLTHSRRFAQCAPTHREATQNGVTS